MSLPYVIGVVGRMGAGKSTITKEIDTMLNGMCDIIELDKLFKETVFHNDSYRSCLNKMFGREMFPDGIFDSTWYISAMHLTKFYEKVSRLITSFMHREVMEALEMTSSSVVVIEGSTLLSSPLSLICDTVIEVFAPITTRYHRVHERDTHRIKEETEELIAANDNIFNTLDYYDYCSNYLCYNNYSHSDDTVDKIKDHLTKLGVFDLIEKRRTSITLVTEGFLLGEEFNSEGLFLNDMIAAEDRWLEETHNYIQWMFPLPEQSKAQPNAPIITIKTIEECRDNAIIISNLKRSARTMLEFYFRNKHWIKTHDHNHLRITRIIKCLRLFGMDVVANNFLNCVYAYSLHKVSHTNVQYWIEANGVTLEEYNAESFDEMSDLESTVSITVGEEGQEGDAEATSDGSESGSDGSSSGSDDGGGSSDGGGDGGGGGGGD